MSKRDNRLYLSDIIDSATAILEYIDQINLEDFKRDRKTQAAVIREFEVIGEAVGKLSEDIKDEYHEVSWQDIKDFRNLLIHEYFGVDIEIVWDAIQNELPLLRRTINQIIAEKYNGIL